MLSTKYPIQHQPRDSYVRAPCRRTLDGGAHANKLYYLIYLDPLCLLFDAKRRRATWSAAGLEPLFAKQQIPGQELPTGHMCCVLPLGEAPFRFLFSVGGFF